MVLGSIEVFELDVTVIAFSKRRLLHPRKVRLGVVGFDSLTISHMNRQAQRCDSPLHILFLSPLTLPNPHCFQPETAENMTHMWQRQDISTKLAFRKRHGTQCRL